MNEILNKIEASFQACLKGEESLHILIYRWGLLAWIAAYFIANRLVKMIDVSYIDLAISISVSIYFAWHIYVMEKYCVKNMDSEMSRHRYFGRRKIIIGCLLSFFIIDLVAPYINAIAIGISVILVILVSIILYVVVSAKYSEKIELSKAEKHKIQLEKNKSFLRKLFLQRSIAQWNPVLIAVIIDAFSIANFVNYII